MEEHKQIGEECKQFQCMVANMELNYDFPQLGNIGSIRRAMFEMENISEEE